MVFTRIKSWPSGEEESENKETRPEPEATLSRIKSPTPFKSEMLTKPGVLTLQTARYGYKATRNGLLRLIIPEGTKVVVPIDAPADSTSPRKLRAEEVYVDKIVPVAGGRSGHRNSNDVLDKMARQSMHDPDYRYSEDEFHVPDEFDDSTTYRCAGGLHFFPSVRGTRKWFRCSSPQYAPIANWEMTTAAQRVRP